MFQDKNEDGKITSEIDSDNMAKIEVLQRMVYYPYGMQALSTFFNKEDSTLSDTRYKYSGKEYNSFTDIYDYGARYYDASIGRWLSVDPLAGKYPGWSPYNYVLGNPVRFVDPDGRDARVAIKGNTITISTTIYIYGSGATKANAVLMQTNIMNAWSKDANGNTWKYIDASTGKTYNVVYDINVKQYDPSDPSNEPGLFSGKNNPFNTDNYVEVDNNSKRSFVKGGDEGVWRGKGRNGMTLSQDDSAPHETGHLLGLPDQYIEGGGEKKGWKGNIMAEPAMQGNVEQKNINNMVAPLIDEYNSSLTKEINENLGTDLQYNTKIDP